MTTATASRRKCYVCNTTVPGDAFTVLADETGVPRSVHVAVHVAGGKAVEITPDCQKTFQGRVADAGRQKARERREDLALAAFKRQFPSPPQRGYDCPAEDCTRYFDSENGRDVHLRKGHK